MVRNDRLKRVRKLAKDCDCTHILVSDVVDVEYISGFRSTNAFLLVDAKKALLATDFRYREQARKHCEENPPWQFVEVREMSTNFVLDNTAKGNRIGYQSDQMTVDQLQLMRKRVAGVRFVPLSGAVSDISLTKLDNELKMIRRAARIGDRAYKMWLEALREGMTEGEAAKLLERYCSDLGSDGPSFATIVLFGSRSALPHGTPSRRRLERGDFVLCDFGCTIQGFCSDMTRTAVMGIANDLQKRMYAAVAAGQANARRRVKAGLAAKTVDEYARSVIRDEGFGERFGHATGHGVGLRIHERPRISATDPTQLRERMVITIEPGVYLPETGGVRIEDMLAVTKDGAQLLTHTPRALVEVPV